MELDKIKKTPIENSDFMKAGKWYLVEQPSICWLVFIIQRKGKNKVRNWGIVVRKNDEIGNPITLGFIDEGEFDETLGYGWKIYEISEDDAKELKEQTIFLSKL